MASEVSRAQATAWLFDNGPRELEALLRAIVHHPESGATAQDDALLLLDVEGRIVTWSSGAARLYGYTEDEMIGKQISTLSSDEGNRGIEAGQELNRAAAQGHFGTEGWHVKSDGARFWANVITMALRDGSGDLQGFARVVRDFSERHEKDEKLSGAVAPAFVRFRRDRPLPASFPASSIGFRRPTTPFSTWWAIARKIC